MKSIKSTKVLVSSYIVMKAINDMREIMALKNSKKEKVFIPELTSEYFNGRGHELYQKTAKILSFNKQFVKILYEGFLDMEKYDFKSDPSVSSVGGIENAHLISAYGPGYTDLKKIDLYNHTLNVLEEAVNEAIKSGRPTSFSIAILGSFFHDFGKASSIRSEFDNNFGARQGYKAHADISELYINEILVIKLYELYPDDEFSMDIFSVLANIVKFHHPQKKEHKENIDIQFINVADHSARKKEKQKLRKNK